MTGSPQGTVPQRHGWIVGCLLLLFFCSGATGLIYEITWTRQLRHVIGNTTFAITTVLCAFMGGLALGSYYGGRLADRRHDWLRLYGLLEGAIGLYCLALPLIIAAAHPVYRLAYQHFQSSFYILALIRFFLCGLILIIPASLMGMTLPILSRFVVRSANGVGWPIGRLYAINTFGAVLGCWLGGFILIPRFGVHSTIYLTTTTNLLLAAAALFLHFRVKNQTASAPVESLSPALPNDLPPSPAAINWLLIGYGLSGLAALIYEIAWTRVLLLIVGSSVYAFSLMLMAFILGLGLGSLIFARWTDRLRRPLLWLGALELVVALAALTAVPIFGQLPLSIGRIIAQYSHSFWLLQTVEFRLILLLMLVPTALLGATFPLLNRLAVRPDNVGATVGRLYCFNTVGSILGSFVGGFILIPAVGIQTTIIIAALVNAVVGAGCFFYSTGAPRRIRQILGGGALAAVIIGGLLLPRWDPLLMSAGPYLTTRYKVDPVSTTTEDLENNFRNTKSLLFYKEGVSTTIAVKESTGGHRTLYVNGKPDASTGKDMATQELCAHLPLLFHPNPRRVLAIGLASGVSAGAAGLHPSVEAIDCVDIEPAMPQATRFFEKYNHQILDDPRLHVIAEDGRLHTDLTRERYDVILSEPSNPWIAGVADLFTLEFFQQCRDRLNPGGIACIWFHGYNMHPRTVRTIARTFGAVFPHVTVWESITADFLLIGSGSPLQLDYGTFIRRVSAEPIRTDLAAIGIHGPRDLLGRFVMDETATREFAADAPLHVDDLPSLEFTAPRYLLDQLSGVKTLEALNEYRARGLKFVHAAPAETAQWAAVESELTQAMQGAKNKFNAEVQYARGLLVEKQSVTRAIAFYQAALKIYPDLPEALNNLAWIMATDPDEKLHDPQQAVVLAERAAKLVQGHNTVILDTLAAAYAAAGRYDEAVLAARKAEEYATLTRDPKLIPEIQRRRELYRAHQPYRSR